MNKSTQDFGIPVLTEIIQTPPARVPSVIEPVIAPDDMEIPYAAEPEPEPVPESVSAQTGHAPITGWLDEEWTRLEQKISERVLTQLLERVDTMLEQRIRDSIAASLQRTVDDIKHDLHQTLEEVINDAVAQEIDNLHFSKK